MKRIRLATAALLATTALAGLAHPARAAIPRFPQPTANGVVFVADGNIWEVARAGGQATRLTSAPGQDMFPRVSPDGKWIAYTEASNAGTDVWVIPASGGPARRLTFHPTVEAGTGGRHAPDNMVVTWTPDSTAVVYLSKADQWNTWIDEAYSVPVAGGAPTRLPLDSAVGLLTYGPDGHTIAYNRIMRNFRTWKRYNGGLAQQVFTYDLTSRQLTQITNWSGTNTSPMWVGRKIYYLSDQDAHRRANIWCYDLDTKQTREITHFTDYDIDFPAYGANAIAFQQGGQLYTLDLPSEQLRAVALGLPDDNTRTRPHVADAKPLLRDKDMAQQVDYALSPNGKRAIFSARGDIFSLPAEHGATRNLTGTQNADEDHPVFSPDGRTIAYTTDINGNQQIATRPAEGGAEKLLTSFPNGYLYGPVWSPDGKMLAFSDSAHKLWTVPASGGAPRQIAQDRLTEIHDQAFSPDSRWLAFSMAFRDHQRRRDLYLCELATGKVTRLGAGGATDGNPVWSPDGKYLYFQSSRHENTVISDTEFDFSVLKSAGIYAIPLAAGTPSPLAPQSDESCPSASPGDDLRKGDRTSLAQNPRPCRAIAPIRMDLDRMMDRAVEMPVEPANIVQMDASGQKISLSHPADLAHRGRSQGREIRACTSMTSPSGRTRWWPRTWTATRWPRAAPPC